MNDKPTSPLEDPTPPLPPPRVRASPTPMTTEAADTANEQERSLRRPGWEITSPGIKLADLVKKEKKRESTRPIKITFSFLGAGAVVTALAGLFVHTDSKAEETKQYTAGAARQAIADETHAREMLEAKVDGLKSKVDRMDVKEDLVLDALHVSQSKRPKPEEE